MKHLSLQIMLEIQGIEVLEAHLNDSKEKLIVQRWKIDSSGFL